MRNLIKKILFEEFHKPRTYVEEVSLSELSLILENVECIESDATIDVDPYKEDEFDAYLNYDIYNQDGFYYDQKSKRSFYIKPTIHWLQRLDRTKETDYQNNPKYFDPTPTEGLDLILKLKDEIISRTINHQFDKSKELCLKLIDVNANNSFGLPYDDSTEGYSEFVEATAKTNVEYTNLIKISRGSHICKMGKQCYGISLITQLKGPEFNSKKYPECKQKIY